MNAKQLTLLPEIDEKEVQQIVIKELKAYRALKIQIQNRREQQEEGVVGLFPSLRHSDRLNEIKVRQMERALEGSLDFIERQIVEMKYLNPEQIKDIEIYLELRIKKNKYYNLKRIALNKLATSLLI
ncbi:ArpU family phage packaging/lysis transcriptional regulator, partial [Terribacillus saccharophilus]|uniref:ArpU family phage packaging/lysis transcriptional regulator n=1 Tax=Terribacillus saccharophilus TaxID=361277 RepID=UPI000BA7C765